MLARAQAKYRKQGARTDRHHANGMKLKQGQNQSAYLLRRLARDRPEILARYERGWPSLVPLAGQVECCRRPGARQEVGPHGVYARDKSTKLVLSKGGTDRQAAQLATRRPNLAEAARSGARNACAAVTSRQRTYR
jgi:hypothetical protein